MKYRVLFIFLSLSLYQVLHSQTYYVAIVKGEVYYKNKLLKKRDKIKMKGQLRFSSPEDYVKISGKGGLHTLRPKPETELDELTLLLKSEMLKFNPFPDVNTYLTASNDYVELDTNYYFNINGENRIYIGSIFFDLDSTLRDVNPELLLAHQTQSGLFYKTAETETEKLKLDKTAFDVRDSLGKQQMISKSAVLLIRNKEVWEKQKVEFNDLDSLFMAMEHRIKYGSSFDPYVFYPMVFDSVSNKYVEQKPEVSSVEILDVLGKTQFIDSREFEKDIRFHWKKSKAKSYDHFMMGLGYRDYIEEVYLGDDYTFYFYELENYICKKMKLDLKRNSRSD